LGAIKGTISKLTIYIRIWKPKMNWTRAA